jgi:hypothetical protein
MWRPALSGLVSIGALIFLYKPVYEYDLIPAPAGADSKDFPDAGLM